MSTGRETVANIHFTAGSTSGSAPATPPRSPRRLGHRLGRSERQDHAAGL